MDITISITSCHDLHKRCSSYLSSFSAKTYSSKTLCISLPSVSRFGCISCNLSPMPSFFIQSTSKHCFNRRTQDLIYGGLKLVMVRECMNDKMPILEVIDRYKISENHTRHRTQTEIRFVLYSWN